MTPGQCSRARDQLRLADQALRVARLALEAGAPEDATSRLYYATFHAASATLTVVDRFAKTHSGQITLFSAQYGPAPILGRLFALRAAADYTTEFRTTAEELNQLLGEAAAFIERCRALVAAALAEEPDEADPLADY